MRLLIFVIFILLLPKSFLAIETIGGEITWECAGGSDFVFELILYRDCNSDDISTNPQQLKVWNHGTITEITVNFISRTNISPTCTQNSTSFPALSCGNGANSGNGLGAVEKLIFRSNSILLPGIPPQEGWIFTFTTSARKASLNNILNPAENGMTIAAKMFEINVVQNSCLDNSPKFLENPYLIVCSGSPYLYMPNCVDRDLDSLVFSLVNPLNNFDAGTFNPPTNPVEVQFLPNFSALSPTPGMVINGSNSAFNLNPSNGDVSFSSVIPGEFVFKIRVESFRNGRKIAEIEREIVVFVKACGDNNNAPIIVAPTELADSFAANFEIGQLVNFTINSTDTEFLQDGTTPQQNTTTISSLILPSTLTNNGVQGSSINVNWQTACSDLKNSFGNEFKKVSYDFVIKVQDDFCQIPKTTFQRVKIKLNTNITLEEAQIQCIKTLANGDLEISWNEVIPTFNDFSSYELHSAQNGLIATFNSISTTSTIVPAINSNHDFFIKTISGIPCDIAVSSDTMSNIFLQLFNPGDGRVTLKWNKVKEENSENLNQFYRIYREYPINTGFWQLIDSVDFSTSQYIDTIDICSAMVNYRVELPTSTCSYTSNVAGDLLEDKISPLMPVISSVSVDTLTGLTVITWNQNSQNDTYGYVIYMSELNGILFELDTVYGVTNTSFSFQSTANFETVSFSIAAFDSCFTDLTPVTYQTSAKSDVHTTSFLSHQYDICSKTLDLSWTKYKGWEYLDSFEVYGRKVGENWELLGKTLKINFQIELEEYQNYEFAILTRDSLNPIQNFAFSNKISFYTTSSSKPKYNYTKLASVVDDKVEIKHYIEFISGVTELALERKNTKGQFEEIQRQAIGFENTFIDEDVQVNEFSYTYRVRIIDSCGNPSIHANEVKTVLLEVISDNIRQTNFLKWNAYEGFQGPILFYNIYRGVDGVFQENAFKTVSPNQLFCEDTIQVTDQNFTGRICYIVDAVEAFNVYGFAELSHSNIACPVYEPIIYVPNSFTPNADGLNDVFKPIVSLLDYSNYVFTVLDRWGQVIFRTTDTNEGWSGEHSDSNKISPDSTYVFVVELKNVLGEEITKRGHITLLR